MVAQLAKTKEPIESVYEKVNQLLNEFGLVKLYEIITFVAKKRFQSLLNDEKDPTFDSPEMVAKKELDVAEKVEQDARTIIADKSYWRERVKIYQYYNTKMDHAYW